MAAAERLPRALCRGQHRQVHQCQEGWGSSVCGCDCSPPPPPTAVCPPDCLLLLGQFCVLPLSRETPALPHLNILPFSQPPPPELCNLNEYMSNYFPKHHSKKEGGNQQLQKLRNKTWTVTIRHDIWDNTFQCQPPNVYFWKKEENIRFCS